MALDGAPRVALGMAHGRFQPFHLGHLEYVERAAARCQRLLVGITNPDRASRLPEQADASRHLDDANPFTYTERAWMIEAALAEAGIEATIVPFPVGEPERWPDYVPATAVHFLRIFDEWGRVKLERLRAGGFEAVVLDEGEPKRVSGGEVRARLCEGGDWQALVPAAVAGVLQRLGRP